MSVATDALRRELEERRSRLSGLQRDESACAQSVEELERQLTQQRRRREQLAQAVRREKEGIGALEAALTVLAERMPAEGPVETETSQSPPENQDLPASRTKGERPVSLRILEKAGEIDLGNLSQRTVERAESVRAVLAAAKDPVEFDAIALGVLDVAREAGEIMMTEGKARTGAEVGLTVLIAEGRARCASAGADTFELTPPERGSSNLGVRLAAFRGRTTSWPTEGALKPGTRITIEEGSYEGGKRT